MGTIGTPITNSIPLVGSSGTQYATDINAFLAEVRTRLEAKVPFSAIIGSGGSLDANNQGIIDVHHLGLYELGVSPTAVNTANLALSVFNGDLWWVTNSGSVQMTVGNKLNSAAIGGIGGDYGSPNPAAENFVDASSTFEFYDDFGGALWAYIKTKGVYFVSTTTPTFNTLLRFSGTTASHTLTLPEPPASGGSMVTLDSSGNFGLGSVSNDIVLTGTAKVQHPTKSRMFTARADAWTLGTPTALPYGVQAVAAQDIYVKLDGFEVGHQISAIVIHLFKATAGATVAQLGATNAAGWTPINNSASTTTSGITSLTVTIAAPVKLASGNSYALKVSCAANLDEIYHIEVQYSTPA